MKTSVVVIGLVCVAVASFVVTSTRATDPRQGEATEIGALPPSLDGFYPPMSPVPAYLFAMLELSRPLSGVVADIQEGDLASAQSNFETFKKAYERTSELIPEWKDRFPVEPITRLGDALSTGNPGAIMPVLEAVGKDCHSCHVTFMATVQHKFRWSDFGNLTITDPLSGQDVSFARLMLMLQTNFTGITNDLAKGSQEGAREQFAGFSARFEAMAGACMTCHVTERLYYVSPDITGMITALQAELGKSTVDMASVGKLMQSIGEESCSKCHLVHIPAAYAQQAARAR